MKKLFTLIVCALPLLSIAQPTITQTDLPVPGEGWLLGTDTAFSGAILAGGPNATWDYSSLANNRVDTTGFGVVAGSLYADSFPSATCASYSVTSGWEYFTSNSSGFYFNGGTFDTTFLKLNPPLQYVPVPFSYSGANASTARGQIDGVYSGFPARFIIYYQSSFAADGWGDLTLPSGMFTNVLRVKDIQVVTDSLMADLTHTGNYTLFSKTSSQTVNYRWYRHGSASPLLLQIDADSAGTTPTQSSYLLASFTVGTKELPAIANGVSIYPNPASDVLTIDMTGKRINAAVINIYNAIGQQLMSEDISETNPIVLPVNKLENGIYYYSIVSDTEKLTGKFVVMH